MDGYTHLTNLAVDGDFKFAGVSTDKPDATAAAGSAPTKAEFDAVVTLVNDIKAKLNALA